MKVFYSLWRIIIFAVDVQVSKLNALFMLVDQSISTENETGGGLCLYMHVLQGDIEEVNAEPNDRKVSRGDKLNLMLLHRLISEKRHGAESGKDNKNTFYKETFYL